VLKVALMALTVAGIAWATLISLFGPAEALPGGSIFALAAIFAGATALASVGEMMGLPALVGALVAGFALSNIPGLALGRQLDPGLASAIRGVALVIILARAGLGLDRAALFRLSGPAARLALIPNLFEAGTAAAVLSATLGWPLQWGLTAGFVLSAVSPAVVVPGLLKLQDEGYGVDKGIPTLIIAAASFDDVIAISGFGVCLSLAFSSGDPVWAGIKSPLELVAGAAFGAAAGVLAAAVVPHRSSGGLAGGAVLLGLGVVAVLGGRLVDVGGGGALGVIISGIIARAAWDDGGALPFLRGLAAWASRCGCCCCSCCGAGGRHAVSDDVAEGAGGVEMASTAGGGAVGAAAVAEVPAGDEGTAPSSGPQAHDEERPAAAGDADAAETGAVAAGTGGEGRATATEAAGWLKTVWTSAGQPALFGLIGAAVDVTVVDVGVLGLGIGAIAAGLVVRCAAAYACLLGTDLSRMERVFLTAAWMPKATVQAAIGPVALDTAIALGAGATAEARGLTVLTLAVVAIVLTAPAGAVLIAWLGRRFLHKTPRVVDGRDERADGKDE